MKGYVRLFRRNIDAEMRGSPSKGYVPILVGIDGEDMKRLWIPIKLINHPYIVSLLDDSVLAFGHNEQGLLRVSCDAEGFKKMVKSIKRRK